MSTLSPRRKFVPAFVVLTLVGTGFVLTTPLIPKAIISLNPQNATFKLGEEFPVRVLVTSPQPVNAIEATVRYPVNLVEVTRLEAKNTIIDLWVFDPTYSNLQGTVSFTGGITARRGFFGEGEVITIYFKSKQPGKINVDFNHALVLAHDGQGTNLLDNPTVGQYTIQERIQASFFVQSPTPPSKDVNLDGAYTFRDLSVFLTKVNRTYDNRYDFNQDGKISIIDASVLLSKVITN